MKKTKAHLEAELQVARGEITFLYAEVKKMKEFAKAETDSSSTLWNPRIATYVSLDKMATAMAKIVEEAVKLARR